MDVGTSEAPSLDLSKATKLKDVVFNYRRSDIQWVTAMIKTIESKNLQQIVIFSYTRAPLSSDQGSGSSGMAGPRPSVGPIVDLTFGSSENHVSEGGGRGRGERSCTKVAARAS